MNGECFLCGNPKYHTQMFDGNGTVTSFDMCDDCQNRIESGIFMTVFKKVRIEIAHKICGHMDCGNVHGHSIDIVIGIRGLLDLGSGMVVDFKTIKHYVQKEVVDKFDHAYLNDTLPVPTAEYLALYIYYQLKIAQGLDVVLVRVHETENNYAEYDGDGFQNV